jgi:hypothetical protein
MVRACANICRAHVRRGQMQTHVDMHLHVGIECCHKGHTVALEDILWLCDHLHANQAFIISLERT